MFVSCVQFGFHCIGNGGLATSTQARKPEDARLLRFEIGPLNLIQVRIMPNNVGRLFRHNFFYSFLKSNGGFK
jgi:hypothetical protein